MLGFTAGGPGIARPAPKNRPNSKCLRPGIARPAPKNRRFFLYIHTCMHTYIRGMRGGARCCAAGLALLLAAGNVLPEHTRTHTLGPLTPTAKIGLLLVARAGLPPTNGDGDRGGSDRGIRGGSGGTALRAPRAGMTCKAELGAERLPILGLQAARSGSPEPNPKP